MKALLSIIDDVPGSGWLLLAAVAASAAGLWCTRLAFRELGAALRARIAAERDEPGTAVALEPRRLQLRVAALASLLLVPVVTLASVQHGRAMFRSALAGVPGSSVDRGLALARGLTGSLDALPLGVMLWAPSLLLGTLACAALLSATWTKRGLATRAAGPPGAGSPRASSVIAVALAWALPGLFGAALAALNYNAGLIAALGRAGDLAPGDRVRHVIAACAAARAPFERGYHVALLAIVVVTTATVAAQLARPAAHAARSSRDWLLGCGCLGAALALLIAIAPYRAENGSPIRVDPEHAAWNGPISRVRLPALDAPDHFELAPVLELDAEHTWLDGRVVDAAALAEDLATLRRNWGILHPVDPFHGSLAVLCDPDTTVARLREWLLIAQRGGYARLQFGFDGFHEYDRLLLGKLKRGWFAAAYATSSPTPPAQSNAVVIALDAAPQRTCGALSSAVVASRRAGREVVLVLGPE